MLEKIRLYTERSTRWSQWIVGGGWDHTLWATKKLPTRQDLDSVTAGHPAVFQRTDGHIVVANTAALQAAGISTLTPDPPGGKIDKASRRHPHRHRPRDPRHQAHLRQGPAAHHRHPP